MRKTGWQIEENVLLTGLTPIGFADMVDIGTEPLDITIHSDMCVAEIGRGLSSSRADTCIDLQGHFVSPGWIDLHTHIYEGCTDSGVDPDRVGPSTGVVMLVDAGSAGESNFLGLRKFIIAQRSFPITAFLNIGSIGLVAGNRISEIAHSNSIDYARTKRCVEENRDVIKGIKVRASRNALGDPPTIQPAITAKRLAKQVGLPLMVHISEPPIFLEELIELLEGGDIITHCFHRNAAYGLPDNPEQGIALYREALNKRILLDVGHGAASFSYSTAKLAIENDIKPHTISSDVHIRNLDGPVWCLAAVISKLLALGLTLEEAIRSVTLHPARVLGSPEWGCVTDGTLSSFTIFEAQSGKFVFKDAIPVDFFSMERAYDRQTSFSGETFLAPRFSFWSGSGLHRAAPRGWEVHVADLNTEE